MKQRMPGLEIIIATGNTPEILRSVLEGRLDVALVTLAARLDRALEAKRLLNEPLVAYAPASLLRPANFVRAAAINAIPLILYERGGTNTQPGRLLVSSRPHLPPSDHGTGRRGGNQRNLAVTITRSPAAATPGRVVTRTLSVIAA
jgi:DNA-binding transcriptional LysR family regulator